MTKNNNALAELAERLKCHDCHDDDFYPAVDKAQRIVAELAKVDLNEIRMAATLPKDGRLIKSCIDEAVWEATDTVDACRAIAEEGAGDGR